jgi:hypothetical protein
MRTRSVCGGSGKICPNRSIAPEAMNARYIAECCHLFKLSSMKKPSKPCTPQQRMGQGKAIERGWTREPLFGSRDRDGGAEGGDSGLMTDPRDRDGGAEGGDSGLKTEPPPPSHTHTQPPRSTPASHTPTPRLGWRSGTMRKIAAKQ